MENNWKVKIIDKGFVEWLDIYVFRKVVGTEFIDVVRNGNTIQRINHDHHVPQQEPSFRLDREQLQAFSEALNDMGINPRKEYIEGKLEATENHLSDMQKLLKLK